MSSTKNKGNAVGAKTARACDSCIRNRARWYCAADDAFLCQACDSSVHSANPLARRHHRVRLKIVSHIEANKKSFSGTGNGPSWHKGFTKKPRTPRHGKNGNKALKNPFDVVPEDTNSNSHEESVDEVLYRVPATPSAEQGVSVSDERRVDLLGCESAFEIAFSADVESLLREGLESECVGMEELGLVGTDEVEEHASWECCVGGGNMKVEEEAYELGFDCGHELNFSLTCEEVKEKVIGLDKRQEVVKEDDQRKKKKILLLRLDYEAVITAWTSQRSLWTTSHKPDLGTTQFWPHCMRTCGVEFEHRSGELFGCDAAMADGGREARVSRYREKRRKRLFSKKIRYEVRKLNAEKRPRMKGRFVKRPSLATPPIFPLLNKKEERV
ncbi:hypothetical protein PHAVU_003G036000 [Phaseolus vulgaris]|uniref:Uncharacterized protein n=1 Tax=Phaseolus vulgaris TaxID=3885 RepID=V7C840_PHAVU|nr:hypothetical protein PHAVU_003G036000g [Phaseolus vulgaris]ESW25440.1 hypothetical protein PHAVU_003G036000g [Phaseolus vulgaris]